MKEMSSLDLFDRTYRERKILITGHSGFGGVWLTAWLFLLGGNILGYSKELISERNRAKLGKLISNIKEIRGDVRDKTKLENAIREYEPDIIFHLAAQALVIPSYLNPFDTFKTNVGGTLNLLDIIRNNESIKAALFVTSDKVYKNIEAARGYREEDELGGYDPYSASKAMCEIAIDSYLNSRREPKFSENPMNISSVRSGNWIGGGDFSDYRLIPDLVKALARQKDAQLRNPNSIRPWQFILDPIKGFLRLGQKLIEEGKSYCGSWNFGPSDSKNYTSEELFRLFISEWGTGSYRIEESVDGYHETNILTLDSQKAMNRLQWKPVYDIEKAIEETVFWYKEYLQRKESFKRKDMSEIYFDQIHDYIYHSRRSSNRY